MHHHLNEGLIMLIYILIGLCSASFLTVFLLFLKQIFNASHATKMNQRVEDQLSYLAKQNQMTEQQLRENLLVNLNNLQQVMTEKLGHSRIEQTQQSAELKEQLQQSFSNHRHSLRGCNPRQAS